MRCLLLLPLLAFTSCATVTRGVHEKLSVQSDPSGANVVLSTGERAVTPATIVKNRRTEPFTVTFSKPGYVPQTVKVESRAGGTGATAMAGNALVGGIIGIGVDAATGAYNSLYPNPVSVHLVPIHGSYSGTSSTTTTTRTKAKPKPETVRPMAQPSPTP